jgi:hypothetical protein
MKGRTGVAASVGGAKLSGGGRIGYVRHSGEEWMARGRGHAAAAAAAAAAAEARAEGARKKQAADAMQSRRDGRRRSRCSLREAAWGCHFGQWGDGRIKGSGATAMAMWDGGSACPGRWMSAW